MSLKLRWSKNTVMLAGLAAAGVLLVSCISVDRAIVAPPQIAGATYVGTKACEQCHGDKVAHFEGSTHSKFAFADSKVGDTGCEACHGPGSSHVAVGGGAGTIINPRKSPEACFQCHLDKRGQFSLPHSHPVLAGRVSCVDCHEVHEGRAVQGSATALEEENETCTKCHTAQKGPFVFEHAAMKEGCTICHNPHGSVNQKMLVARDANLCLRCHLEKPDVGGSGINANAIAHTQQDHASRLMQGTCWSALCHEMPHGSNTNNHLRR